MATARAFDNGASLVEWTDEILNLDNQYGLINGLGLFDAKGVSQTSIVFDKVNSTTTLLPQVSRRSGAATKGVGRSMQTFSLPLGYFKHEDSIVGEDIQGYRKPGTAGDAETFADVRIEKLTDMRMQVDQTLEYMKMQAIKGVTKTPDGATLADMFTEFSVSQQTVAFALATSTTDVDGKIAELKRKMTSSLRTGGVISGIDLIVDDLFFDKLVSHPNIRAAYASYQNSGAQRLRDDMSQYMSWGVVDHFEHRGVRFMTYDAIFNLPDGTTEAAVAANTGHAVPRGTRNLFKGFYGPTAKLAGAGAPGREMFAYEYADPRGNSWDLEVETAPLFVCTQPLVLVEATTT